MRITLTGLIHIVVSLVLLVYSIAYQNHLSLSLSLTLLLIYYYEYVLFLDAMKSASAIEVQRLLEKPFSNELEEVRVSLVLRNRSNSLYPMVLIYDQLPKFVVANPSKGVFKAVLPPRGSIVIEYGVKPLTPGVHEFKGTVLRFSDTLGYFHETIEVDNRSFLVVLPLSTHVNIKLKSLQRILGVAVEGKAVGGMYDLANIREYVANDDPRRILWKVYAKTGKLMVREDFGETFTKVLLLIDMREYLWHMGLPPNTLAQIQLRYARSLVEFLARNRCAIDIAICSGATPKVMRNAERDPVNAIYSMVSILPVEGGCESPISIFTSSVHHLGRDPEYYDAVLLVTNPISLILDGSLEDLENLSKIFPGRLILTIPRYRYDELVERDKLHMFLTALSTITERTGMSLVISDEDLYIYGG